MQKPRTVGVIGITVVGLLLGGAALAQPDNRPPPLPIEPTGVIERLPGTYPESWFLVYDAAFFHMSDGKVYIIDTDEDIVPDQVKGMFNVSLMGHLGQSARRGEIYAVETFHSRGTRGERIDVLTIWDKETLSPAAEVVLPTGKRYMGMPQRYVVVPLDNDRLLAIANFSPATSVTVIDLDKREIISEIPTPGCSFVYPTGKLGFSSLCADGRFMSSVLNADGSLASQTRGEVFFSSDTSPIYERPAIIGDTAYFPSIAGLVFPVDLRGEVALPGQPWNLVPESERGEKWAPGGIALIDRDDIGRFYILMHPDSKDGSYQGGGPEVWVFDAAKQKRVLRIALQEWGLSLAVSRGKNPVLMVTNPTDMSVETYNTSTGEFIKKISNFGQETPLMLHGSL